MSYFSSETDITSFPDDKKREENRLPYEAKISALLLTKCVTVNWKAHTHIFILKDKGQEGILQFTQQCRCEYRNHVSILSLLLKKLNVSKGNSV